MSLWPGTVIPCWRTSPSMAESGVSKTSAFRFVLWTVCSPYPNLNLRRTIFSSRRCTDLEQSSAAYLICSVTSCLLLSLEDILLRTLLPVILLSCLRSDTVIYGHVNRSYLLPQRCNFEWRAAKFRTTWSVATSVRQLSFFNIFKTKLVKWYYFFNFHLPVFACNSQLSIFTCVIHGVTLRKIRGVGVPRP